MVYQMPGLGLFARMSIEAVQGLFHAFAKLIAGSFSGDTFKKGIDNTW